MRITVSVFLLTISLVSSALATCLETGMQVQEVYVLWREDPRPYVAAGVARMRDTEVEYYGLSREELVDHALDRNFGELLVVSVRREVTIRLDWTGKRRRLTYITPWVEVGRMERLWWPHSAGDLDSHLDADGQKLALYSRRPCCDTIPTTNLPCLVGMNEAQPVPEWLTPHLPEAND